MVGLEKVERKDERMGSGVEVAVAGCWTEERVV